MCEVTTLLALSTAVSAAGSLYQGAATKAAEDYNARVAGMQADQERQKAAWDEARARRDGDLTLQGAAADWAKSGFRLDSGSPLEAMAKTAATLETDALLIRREGQNRGSYYERERAMAKARGRSAVIGGVLGAAGSVLQGATTWQGMK